MVDMVFVYERSLRRRHFVTVSNFPTAWKSSGGFTCHWHCIWCIPGVVVEVNCGWAFKMFLSFQQIDWENSAALSAWRGRDKFSRTNLFASHFQACSTLAVAANRTRTPAISMGVRSSTCDRTSREPRRIKSPSVAADSSRTSPGTRHASFAL